MTRHGEPDDMVDSDAEPRGGGARSPPAARPPPLVGYAILWIGGAVGVVLLALLGHGRARRRHDPSPPGAPAGRRRPGLCARRRLLVHARRGSSRGVAPTARGRHGPRARAAPDGSYAETPPRGTLIAALAAGSVVIQYRPALAVGQRTLLERLYARDKAALILTPDATGMQPPVAVTAWRRVLACPRVSQGTLDAIAEFRDRFRGRGPG